MTELLVRSPKLHKKHVQNEHVKQVLYVELWGSYIGPRRRHSCSGQDSVHTFGNEDTSQTQIINLSWSR